MLTLEEDDRSLNKSLKYFIGYFESLDTSYDDFILDLLGTDENELQQYFKNPDLNLNIKENKKNIEITSNNQNNESLKESHSKTDVIQKEKLQQIEKEIREIEILLKQQQSKEQIQKKKSNFFRRFFLGE